MSKQLKSMYAWLVIYPDNELLLGNLYFTEYTAKLVARSSRSRKWKGKVVRVRIAPAPIRARGKG